MRVVSAGYVGRGGSGASELPITDTVRPTHRAVFVSGAHMPVCSPKPHRKSFLRGPPRSAIETCLSEGARLPFGWRGLGLERVGLREAHTTNPSHVHTHTPHHHACAEGPRPTPPHAHARLHQLIGRTWPWGSSNTWTPRLRPSRGHRHPRPWLRGRLEDHHRGPTRPPLGGLLHTWVDQNGPDARGAAGGAIDVALVRK